MEKKIDIGGELHSVATGHKVADASEIKDISKGNKSQTDFNNDVDRHEVEIHGTGGIESRLTDVEQLEQIALDGGEAQIAQGSDFTNPDAAKRAKIPTVGAVVDGLNDGIYDVSKRNPTGGPNSDGKFILKYILDKNNVNTLIPTGWRHGGMTISFVSTSDNKYVQYRLMTSEWSTIESNWERYNYVTTEKIADGAITTEKLDKDLKENIEILNSINETYNITSTKKRVGTNSWIGSTGNQVSVMPTAIIWIVLVKPNTKYLIKMSVPTETNTVRKGYAFYSSNSVSSNTFISGSDDYPGSDKDITIEVTTPINCYMIAFSGYSDRDNFEIYSRYTAAREDEFLEVKEEVNSNSSKINDINDTITGIDNRDITDTLVWKKARWLTGTNYPNGAESGYNYVQKIWYTRIDVSKYDTITCNSFANGISVSTPQNTLSGINIYGDGHLRKIIVDASRENTIYRSEYSQYSKLELVLQAKSSSDDEFIGTTPPSVIVYKAGISQEKPKHKRIVLVGDSLCGNNSALIIKQFNSLAAFTKYELVPRCMGGENAIGNLTRAGGIGIRVKAEFTIPASGSVNCALESAWIRSTGVYAGTPYNTINNNVQVVINGIRGKLAKSELNAVGIAFYTSDGTFISGLINSGTFDIPSNATQYTFTINEPATGVPHITINGDAVEDLSSKATRSGYIDNTGTFVSSESFKCSELLPISQGEIYIDSLATSTGYVFTRLKEGEETKIGVGNVFFDAALYDDKDYPHIWFTGQNGGYETDEDWANMVSSAANNFSEKYIVCSTALDRTTDKLIYQANKCFGARYLNLRAYTQGQAVYDGQKLGIIDAQYSASDYETLFWPGSDKVHQNNKLSYIWAVKMWNQLLELGYVEGERIETGEYYVP